MRRPNSCWAIGGSSRRPRFSWPSSSPPSRCSPMHCATPWTRNCAEAGMDKLIEVRDLKVAFRLGDEMHEAVKGVSFDVPTNTTVALVGESGSGKSVSAMSIMRLLPDNAVIDPLGKVIWEGSRDLLQASQEDMRRMRGKDISVVFQEP